MSNRTFDELSTSFDPDVWPVYSCVWNLYRHCDHYELSGDSVCWVFLLKEEPYADLSRIYESFRHHEVNFCSRVAEELFDGPEWSNGRVLISCYIPHLWGKMFDCLRTDRVSAAVSPSRRPKRSSQRHKNNSPRR
nr:MAG TPA: hypothetical protein [Microviridae sp.]